MINLAVPKTREDVISHLRDIVSSISDLQFQLGIWAQVAVDDFGMDRSELADEINIGYNALCEYIGLRRFWHPDGLSGELNTRIDDLHIQRQNGVLTYTHFRQARRVGRAGDAVQTRVEQVVKAVDWLESVLHMKHSQMEASAITSAGKEPFQEMIKRYDSRIEDYRSALDIARSVEIHIRGIRQSGHDVRVVVYEVNGNA